MGDCMFRSVLTTASEGKELVIGDEAREGLE